MTQAEFEKGYKIGLDNRLMLRRVRQYGWSHEKAITTPRELHKRRGKKDEN
jgi:hypothetical protein